MSKAVTHQINLTTNDEWETPKEILQDAMRKYQISPMLDVCATDSNSKFSKYSILHNQYMTNIETRQLDLISKHFQKYLNELVNPTSNSIKNREMNVTTIESVIFRLISGFKTVPSSRTRKLRQPISEYFVTDKIKSSRSRLN